MAERRAAVSQFLRAQAKALNDLADALDAGSPIPAGSVSAVSSLPILRGSRQRQVVHLPGLDTESGMTTTDIANAIAYSVANTHALLRSMEAAGVIERVVQWSTATRWRLAPRYRDRAAVVTAAAALIRRGEWTTFGDISLAATGTLAATDLVKQAATTRPDFPHPHRVLGDGGLISPNWRDAEGHGPEDCRLALMSEGVEFTADRAHPRQRVTWDEFQRRHEDQPAQHTP